MMESMILTRIALVMDELLCSSYEEDCIAEGVVVEYLPFKEKSKFTFDLGGKYQGWPWGVSVA